MARLEYALRHYVDGDGKYLGGFAGIAMPPPGAVEVPAPPPQTWREKRREAIREQVLGSEGALAEIVEILVVEMVARGAAQSPEFQALLAKVAAIRAAFPRP